MQELPRGTSQALYRLSQESVLSRSSTVLRLWIPSYSHTQPKPPPQIWCNTSLSYDVSTKRGRLPEASVACHCRSASAHDVCLVLWARHTGGGVVGAEDGRAPAVASGRGRAAEALQVQPPVRRHSEYDYSLHCKIIQWDKRCNTSSDSCLHQLLQHWRKQAVLIPCTWLRGVRASSPEQSWRSACGRGAWEPSCHWRHRRRAP